MFKRGLKAVETADSLCFTMRSFDLPRDSKPVFSGTIDWVGWKVKRMQLFEECVAARITDTKMSAALRATNRINFEGKTLVEVYLP